MFSDKKRYGQDPNRVVRSKPATFDAPSKWQREAEQGDRVGTDRLVFTCSWSDWFLEEADPWRDDAWEVVRSCPLLTFQVLTKRPGRIADRLPSDWGAGYPNVWLGVSVEDQATARERIPRVLRVPAVVRFLSCEPLLGPVDPTRIEVPGRLPVWDALTGERSFRGESTARIEGHDARIAWVVVGGESGPHARPMHPAWARSLRDRCVAAGVGYFFKQWGGWAPVGDDTRRGAPLAHVHRHGGFTRAASGYEPGCPCDSMPGDEPMALVGKEAAGRRLDGRTWDEFPAVGDARSAVVPMPRAADLPGQGMLF